MENNDIEKTQELDDVVTEIGKLIEEEDNPNRELEKQLRLLEAIYVSDKGLEASSPEVVDLFPSGWFEPGNYLQKIDALSEAMEFNRKIIDTDAYQSLVEGVRK